MHKLIYQGSEIVAHHHEGKSDFLLITFICASFEQVADTTYFLQSYVNSYDVNAIGITTRRRTYYISDEMTEVLELVKPYTERFRVVIVCGLSMGGYAAIKYSSRLSADCVLALSPVFSTDLNDLEIPEGIQARYVERMLKQGLVAHNIDMSVDYAGMGIRTEDCAGLVVSIYDPKHTIDGYNSWMIRRRYPDLMELKINNYGHGTGDIFDIDGAAARIIDAAATLDPATIRRAFQITLRVSPPVRMNLLTRLARRKPALCLRALDWPSLASRPMRDAIGFADIPGRIAYRMIELHQDATAGSTLQARLGIDVPAGFAEADRAERFLADPDRRALLLTVHGNFIGFDTNRNAVVLSGEVFKRKGIVPVIASRQDGQAAFFVMMGSERVPVSLLPSSDAEPAALSYEPAGHGRVAIRAGDRYVRARDDGTLDTHATAIDLWESFALVPGPSDDALFTTSFVNWFERSLLSVPPIEATRATAQRKSGWFSKLIGRA